MKISYRLLAVCGALLAALFCQVPLLVHGQAQAPDSAPIKTPELWPYVQKFPESYFPAYLGQVLKLLKEDEADGALKELEKIKLTAKRPASPEKIYLLEGVGHQLKGRHQAALDSFKAALRLRGSNCDIYFFVALSHLALNQKSMALTALQDALWFNRISLVPIEEFYLLIGQIERAFGNNIKASQAFNAALAKNPSFFPARAALLSLSMEAGKRSSAVRAARAALALNPESIELKAALVEALLLNADRTLDKEQIAEAKKLTASLAATKGLSQAQELLIIPLQIKALLASGELSQAEKVLEGARRRHPGKAQLEALQSQIDLEKQALTAQPGKSANGLGREGNKGEKRTYLHYS